MVKWRTLICLDCCRTLLVFSPSIKPESQLFAVEMHGAEDFRGFSEVPMQTRGVKTVPARFHARQAQLAVRATSFSQHTNNHNNSHRLF
jgi:hypothetical protein